MHPIEPKSISGDLQCIFYRILITFPFFFNFHSKKYTFDHLDENQPMLPYVKDVVHISILKSLISHYFAKITKGMYLNNVKGNLLFKKYPSLLKLHNGNPIALYNNNIELSK